MLKKFYNCFIEYNKNLLRKRKFFQQIRLNNVEAVKILLEENNNLLYAYCGRGQTGLIKACEINSLAMVELFIKYGIKKFINLRDYQFGTTALHYACQNNNVNMVDLLIKNGASFEIQDNDGMNSLHTISEFNNSFLAKHIDVYIGNSNMKNTLHVKDKIGRDCFKINNNIFSLN